MLYFFDTNALVRRYLFDDGSAWVQQVLEQRSISPFCYISELTRVEMLSSFYKIERIRKYHPSFMDAAVARFNRHMQLSDRELRQRRYEIIPLGEDAVERAQSLLRKYRGGVPQAIRSLDALQLAAALIARDSLSAESQSQLMFVTSDHQLGGVAQHEGFTVIRPEDQLSCRGSGCEGA